MASPDSCTKACEIRSISNDDGEFLIMDSPGMNDSEGKDTAIIEHTVKFLKDEVQTVNAFVLVLNSQEPRMMAEHVQDMLKLFGHSFGWHFLKNVVCCFTRWGYDRVSFRSRTRSHECEASKKEAIKATLLRVIQSSIGFAECPDDIPCVFLDNVVLLADDDDFEADDNLQRHQEELQKLLHYAKNNKPFTCEGIEAIKARKDAAEARVEHAEAALKEEQDRNVKVVQELNAAKNTLIDNFEKEKKMLTRDEEARRRKEFEAALKKKDEELKRAQRSHTRAAQSREEEVNCLRMELRRAQTMQRQATGGMCGARTTRGTPCKRWGATCPYH